MLMMCFSGGCINTSGEVASETCLLVIAHTSFKLFYVVIFFVFNLFSDCPSA